MNVDLKDLRRDWELAKKVHDETFVLTKELRKKRFGNAAEYLEERVRDPAKELEKRLFERLGGSE